MVLEPRFRPGLFFGLPGKRAAHSYEPTREAQWLRSPRAGGGSDVRPKRVGAGADGGTRCSLDLAVIFAVASLASRTAWELDHEVLSTLFAVAAGVAFAMTPSE